MEEQRQRARGGSATAHGSEDRHERVLAFAGAAPPTHFVGYEMLRSTTGLAAVEREDGRALVKLEESPFYAEGGGQVADSGTLSWEGGEARVIDVYRVGEDQALEVEPTGEIDPSAAVVAEVDRETRHATMRNHTATHLLHAALRERLGTHVRQAGSAVRPDKLRFDFTHGQGLGAEDLRAVEDRVNEWIKASRPVRWIEMERAEAERLGAMALFGEKYGEWVRVVEVDGGLARALRRHPRRQHGRDRHLQDRLRGLQRRQRAPDRGAQRAGGDRLVPRARAAPGRGRRAARLAAGPDRGRPPRRRAPARGRQGCRAGAEAAAGRGGRASGRRGGRGERRQARRLAGPACRSEAAARAGQPGPVEARRRGRGGARRGRGQQGRAGRPRLQGARSSAASRRRRSCARRRRSSAAVAAAATTWPRPAARTRTSSTRRWRPLGRRSKRAAG